MSGNAFYLCLREAPSQCVIYPLTSDGGGPLAAFDIDDMQAAIQVLDKACANGKQAHARLVLGLPASWCLCATVLTEGLESTRRAQWPEALGFRLESLLPITIEDHTCGFLGEDEQRLGIATRTDRLLKLVRALEDHGHEVEAIVPRALLAAQHWTGSRSSQANTSVVCWHEDPEQTDDAALQLMVIREGHPVRWRCLEPTSTQLAAQLRLDAVNLEDVAWLATEQPTGLVEQLLGPSVDDDANAIESVTHPINAELDSARSVINHKTAPWINLNRGDLAPRHRWRRLRVPASATIAAAVLLLVTLSAVLLWRAEQYRQITSTYDNQARSAFTQAMPGHAVPPSPQRRLKGRLQKLRGEQGLAAGDESLTDDTPVLTLLRDALAALPAEQRFVVTDLRLEDGELRLTGHARSHGEADQLAGALRRHSRFIVEPPSTENLADGGVRFTLQATYPPPEGATSTPAATADRGPQNQQQQRAAASDAPAFADQRAGGDAR